MRRLLAGEGRGEGENDLRSSLPVLLALSLSKGASGARRRAPNASLTVVVSDCFGGAVIASDPTRAGPVRERGNPMRSRNRRRQKPEPQHSHFQAAPQGFTGEKGKSLFSFDS